MHQFGGSYSITTQRDTNLTKQGYLLGPIVSKKGSHTP